MKKLSFWDILASLVVVGVLGLAVVFLNIFVNPYSSLNPFPPATKVPATKTGALTQTLQTLPGIWTGTPGTLEPSTATLIPPTLTAPGPIYVLPTWTSSPYPYKTPNYTLTAYFARKFYTPTRTVTPFVPTITGVPCVTSGINVYCDDTMTGSVKYYGTWDTYSGNGPYNNTAHYSSTVGSSLSFTFTGSKVTYIFPTYYTRGHAAVYIDGVYTSTVNLNTPDLRWQQLWDSPVLANGTHSITLVVQDGTIDLDGFIVNRTGAALTNTPGAPATSTMTAPPVPTGTRTATVTHTTVPVITSTNTIVVVPPTPTNTNTAVVVPPTPTNTNTAVVVPPTPTNTNTNTVVVVPPTNTFTPIPTNSDTLVPVVPTNTDTIVPTNTDTPIPPPTNTDTAVPVPPTMTDTVVVVPPSETPTMTFTAVITCSLLSPTQTPTPTLEPTPTAIYTPIPVACTITGNAGAGTILTVTGDAGAQITQPDGAGNYSIAIPNNWSGTIIPTRVGYAFTPDKLTYALVVANISGANFTPTSVGTFNITGNAGVGSTLTVTSGAVVAQQPDASGNYIVTVTNGWTGTITPHHATCTFTPESQPYPGGVGMDLPDQNFTQTCPP
jgi:type VI secretion system secreted protein VgrG